MKSVEINLISFLRDRDKKDHIFGALSLQIIIFNRVNILIGFWCLDCGN